MPIDPPRRRRHSPSYTSPRPSTTLKDSIKIEMDFDGDLLVTTPFNKRFVEALKEAVDQDSRHWTPDQKVWWVDSAYESEILTLIKKHFGVNMKDKITPTKTAEPKPDDNFTSFRTGFSGYTDDDKDGTIHWTKAYADIPLPNGASWWENGPEARPATDSIEDLTERISVLTYQLKCEKERVEGKDRIIQATRDQVARANATVANLQRANNELQFKATMAQAQAATQAGLNRVNGFRFGQANASPKEIKLAAAYEELHLAPGAPPEIVEAAWKAMMKTFHPDRSGGDAEKTKRANAAHDTIVHKDLPY